MKQDHFIEKLGDGAEIVMDGDQGPTLGPKVEQDLNQGLLVVASMPANGSSSR